MPNITQKKAVQNIITGFLIAPQVERQLKNLYSISRVEQGIILLVYMMQKDGFTVSGPDIIKAKVAHPRNTRCAIVSLIEKGFLNKQRLKNRHSLKFKLTESGELLIQQSLRLTNQIYKSILPI